MSEWISVNERSPLEGQWVDVSVRGARYCGVKHEKGVYTYHLYTGEDLSRLITYEVPATHWMPIPEQPNA